MSKIFTDAELKSLEERNLGSKKDKNGMFAGRVKPKIKELLEIWFPKHKELKKLMETKK